MDINSIPIIPVVNFEHIYVINISRQILILPLSFSLCGARLVCVMKFHMSECFLTDMSSSVDLESSVALNIPYPIPPPPPPPPTYKLLVYSYPLSNYPLYYRITHLIIYIERESKSRTFHRKVNLMASSQNNDSSYFFCPVTYPLIVNLWTSSVTLHFVKTKTKRYMMLNRSGLNSASGPVRLTNQMFQVCTCLIAS